MFVSIFVGAFAGAVVGFGYETLGLDLGWLFTGVGHTVKTMGPMVFFTGAGALGGFAF